MSAAEILQRMREEKTKRPDGVVADPEDFYVKLAVLTYRRRQLALYLIVAFVALMSLVAQHIQGGDRPWGLVALPCVLVGLIVSLIPPSEQWLYRPWQARARQYERHQIERR